MATIPIADVITTERLPIDAQDIVTKVRLVIAGNIGGREPYAVRAVDDFSLLGTGDTGNAVDTFPLPTVYVYTAPEHATYGVERSFSLPEGFNPFLNPDDALVPEPTLVSNFTNPGSPSAIRDGDPTTYAELSGSGEFFGQLTYETVLPSCGWRLRYSRQDGTGGSKPWWQYVRSLHRHVSSPPVLVRTLTQRNFELPETASIDEPVDMYVLSLHDARGEDENLGDGWVRNSNYGLNILGTGGAEARVYAFYPLILNELLLEDVAKANIRLPATNPSRVTVTGYVAPDREHTIVGWPGGDFTAEVAQHQYELGRTIIDFEQAGAPSGLPAEAIESARERRAATTALVQTANYSLMMGERQ